MQYFYMLLLLFLILTIIITIRIVLLMFITIKKGILIPKRKPNENVKTLIVIGSGGHTSEMMYIVEALHPVRYSPRIYVVAQSDTWSEQKVSEIENRLKMKSSSRGIHEVVKIPRSRRVHQSYLSSVFTTLYSVFATVPVLLKYKPELILCNGPGTCIPVCVVAFLMRCFFISNSTIIFIESICRVQSLSLSGKILQWFADEILVQWPELALKCSRAKYIGRVI